MAKLYESFAVVGKLIGELVIFRCPEKTDPDECIRRSTCLGVEVPCLIEVDRARPQGSGVHVGLGAAGVAGGQGNSIGIGSADAVGEQASRLTEADGFDCL